MAGNFSNTPKTAPHNLFDLTIEDDRILSESELAQLVNYGQLQKTVKVPGIDGNIFSIELALLWDEDHIDVLQRTTSAANDPLLRVRLMRKLKLFKAIQKIDNHDFSNKEDPIAQRKLWTVLSRMADRLIEQLDALYNQIELERDLLVLTAMKQLTEGFSNTMPPELKPKKAEQTSVEEHIRVFEQHEQQRNNTAETLTPVIKEVLGQDTNDIPKSPVQDPNRSLEETEGE